MKVFYEIYKTWSEEDIKYLEKFDLKVELNKFSKLTLDDNKFSLLESFFNNLPDVQIAWGTNFNKKEVLESEQVLINGFKSYGYPQPEEDFGYLNKTYDLTNYCKRCGVGAVQNDLFRLKSEPKWSKNWLFQLTWVYDELFCEKNFYETFLSDFGIGYKEVLNNRTNKIIPNIVQLEIPALTLPFDYSEYSKKKFTVCEGCKRIKYSPFINGYFPLSESVKPISSTVDYFGSGGLAYKRLIISSELRDLLLEKNEINMRQLTPCSSKGSSSVPKFRL